MLTSWIRWWCSWFEASGAVAMGEVELFGGAVAGGDVGVSVTVEVAGEETASKAAMLVMPVWSRAERVSLSKGVSELRGGTTLAANSQAQAGSVEWGRPCCCSSMRLCLR
nr:hypothetical protein [Micromonospora chalcea]